VYQQLEAIDMQTYWLTDGAEIFNSENLEEHEVAGKQQEAEELTGGNMYWVSEEPNLPRADSFRHISREDMALNRQGK
jgi:hypothetical protein